MYKNKNKFSKKNKNIKKTDVNFVDDKILNEGDKKTDIELKLKKQNKTEFKKNVVSFNNKVDNFKKTFSDRMEKWNKDDLKVSARNASLNEKDHENIDTLVEKSVKGKKQYKESSDRLDKFKKFSSDLKNLETNESEDNPRLKESINNLKLEDEDGKNKFEGRNIDNTEYSRFNESYNNVRDYVKRGKDLNPESENPVDRKKLFSKKDGYKTWSDFNKFDPDKLINLHGDAKYIQRGNNSIEAQKFFNRNRRTFFPGKQHFLSNVKSGFNYAREKILNDPKSGATSKLYFKKFDEYASKKFGMEDEMVYDYLFKSVPPADVKVLMSEHIKQEIAQVKTDIDFLVKEHEVLTRSFLEIFAESAEHLSMNLTEVNSHTLFYKAIYEMLNDKRLNSIKASWLDYLNVMSLFDSKVIKKLEEELERLKKELDDLDSFLRFKEVLNLDDSVYNNQILIKKKLIIKDENFNKSAKVNNFIHNHMTDDNANYSNYVLNMNQLIINKVMEELNLPEVARMKLSKSIISEQAEYDGNVLLFPYVFEDYFEATVAVRVTDEFGQVDLTQATTEIEDKSFLVTQDNDPAFMNRKTISEKGYNQTSNEDSSVRNDSRVIDMIKSGFAGAQHIITSYVVITDDKHKTFKNMLNDTGSIIRLFDPNPVAAITKSEKQNFRVIRMEKYALDNTGLDVEGFNWDKKFGEKPFIIKKDTQTLQTSINNFDNNRDITVSESKGFSPTILTVYMPSNVDITSFINNTGSIEKSTAQIEIEPYVTAKDALKKSWFHTENTDIILGEDFRASDNTKKEFYSFINYYNSAVVKSQMDNTVSVFKAYESITDIIIQYTEKIYAIGSEKDFDFQKIKVDTLFNNSANSDLLGAITDLFSFLFTNTEGTLNNWSQTALKQLFKDLGFGSKPMNVKDFASNFINQHLVKSKLDDVSNISGAFYGKNYKDDPTVQNLRKSYFSGHNKIKSLISYIISDSDSYEVREESNGKKVIVNRNLDNYITEHNEGKEASLNQSFLLYSTLFNYNVVENLIFIQTFKDQTISETYLKSVGSHIVGPFTALYDFVFKKINSDSSYGSSIPATLLAGTFNSKILSLFTKKDADYSSQQLFLMVIVSLILRASVFNAYEIFNRQFSNLVDAFTSGSKGDLIIPNSLLAHFGSSMYRNEVTHKNLESFHTAPTTSLEIIDDKIKYYLLDKYQRTDFRHNSNARSSSVSSIDFFTVLGNNSVSRSSLAFNKINENVKVINKKYQPLRTWVLYNSENPWLKFNVVGRTNVDKGFYRIMGIGPHRSAGINFESIKIKNSEDLRDSNDWLFGNKVLLQIKANQWDIASLISGKVFTNKHKNAFNFYGLDKSVNVYLILFTNEKTNETSLVREMITENNVITRRKTTINPNIKVRLLSKTSFLADYKINVSDNHPIWIAMNEDINVGIYEKIILADTANWSDIDRILYSKATNSSPKSFDIYTWINILSETRSSINEFAPSSILAGDSIDIKSAV